MLYMGYVGFSVGLLLLPIAALIEGVSMRAWTRLFGVDATHCLAFLTLGIASGVAWWPTNEAWVGAAVVLDPVGNASLLPWSEPGLALIQFTGGHEKRGTFRA